MFTLAPSLAHRSLSLLRISFSTTTSGVCFMSCLAIAKTLFKAGMYVLIVFVIAGCSELSFHSCVFCRFLKTSCVFLSLAVQNCNLVGIFDSR